MEKILYELTNPQKNIMELQKVNPENESIAHISASLKLDGVLDINLLKKTLNIVIQKNDSYHIRLVEKDSKIFQYFVEDVPEQDFEVRKFATDDISDFIQEYNNLQLSFNKLFSFAIAITPNYTYILYKTHHIIADGWAMTQFSEQVKEIYCKLKNNEDLSTFSRPSYLDVIKREDEYMNSAKYSTDYNFWKDYTAKINTDKLFQSDDIFDKTSKRSDYELPINLSDKIEQFCNEKHITEYVFFLAVFSIYFSKIYNTNSFVFGTPFLNRQKKYGEMDCVGLFISTLPLIVNINKDEDFIELCKNISSNNFSIFKHSRFPYAHIEKLYHENSKDSSNLYEIGFSYQVNELNYKMDNGSTGSFEWYFLGTQNNPLTIHLSVPNHKRLLSYDYWTSCFTEEEIEKVNKIILHIIEQVLDDVLDLKNINLLCKEDFEFMEKFLSSGNVEKSDYSVPDLFKKVAKTYSDKTAIICEDKSITYNELDLKSDALADFMVKNGLKKGDAVALFFEKSIDMIVSILAVLKAGGCYVPILPDEETSRINYILSNSSPFCILTKFSFLDKLDNDLKIYCLDNMKLSQKVDFKANVLPTDIAYMIYTSGSTGNPKGTMVMHKNICDLMKSISEDEVVHADSSDVSMSLLKYSFDASGIDIYTSLLFGGTLILVSKDDELNPSKVLGIIEKHKVTRSFLIPKWLEHISIENATGKYDLSSLKILGAGGETLKPSIIASLLKAYPNLKILNLYGPTETTMFTTCKVITSNEIDTNHTSIGRPIFGARLCVVNSFYDFLPPNTKGELVIFEDANSISNIAKGYLHLPEQTEKKFIEIYNPIIKKNVRAYRTGDIAKINYDGELEFLGRDDDIVKVNGGYLVALNEIENKIQKLLGDYFDSYLIAVPFKNTKMIILFVVQKEKNIKLHNLKSYINNNITFYMRPKKIIKLDEFPRNSSGKIDRKTLKKIAENYLQTSSDTIILPRTQTEKELFQILRKFVDIETLSITDDFIDDLGIDSLTLTSFYSCLDKYKLSIQDIYNNPNIEELANYIDNSSKAQKLDLDLSNISDAKILNNVTKFDLSNVLITGVTGFLGIHLLKDLLFSDKTKKIYCIIRNKINQNGKQRLDSMIKYYFNNDEKILELVDKKIVILNGDVTKDFLGLGPFLYKELRTVITTVINSAANVRHFVKPAQIMKDNVESVQKIIDFCGTQISLAHISTLSVIGNHLKAGSVFDENSLYVGQELNNPYLISKFEAEKIILCAINNNKLNACIFRMGNIMPRLSDGVFQENANQNAFIVALKAIIDCNMLPDSFVNIPIEFSPVDECSKFVISLLEHDFKYTIYHIANNNNFTFADLQRILAKLNIKLDIVSWDTFINNLTQYADEYTKEYLSSNEMTTFMQARTIQNLKSINLDWKNVDLDYIKYIINIINNLK